MSPRRRRALLILLAAGALALVLAPDALASAGGGSSGFSDGGGGGGGGGGNGFALYLIFDLLIHIAVLGHGLGAIALVVVGLGYLFVTRVMPRMADDWQARAAKRGPRRHRRGPSQRERRVELAAAEAAESDPAWAADEVRAAAAKLFMDIQVAWDADDRGRLHTLVGDDLMREWDLRLDDFDRRGWRNRVQVLGEPSAELVGLNHRGEEATDRVVVRIDARMKDYVIDRSGRHLKRNGRLGETTRVREFWSLGRSAGHWKLISIEENREGAHALDEQIVATPWADERGLRDAALVEGAVADAAPKGTSPAELASVSYEGNAQAAANDLSLADGRFSPDILEVAARRAVQGWAEAIDGPDDALDAIATQQAKRELLYAGDTSGSLRMVVRGPVVKRIRIVALDPASEPATMTIEVDLTGRRYLENRDTAAVVAGSRTRAQSFTERWTLSLTDDERQPWRITSAGTPVGLA
jgi:predicted lipid-binding transport protein (Tim44 family)